MDIFSNIFMKKYIYNLVVVPEMLNFAPFERTDMWSVYYKNRH